MPKTNTDGSDNHANFIRMCGELACLLEVSGTPKPGNVHRFSDFEDLRYEDFLASSVSLGYWIEALALKGILIAKNEIDRKDVGLGKTIFSAIRTSTEFHNHGNTNLGIILLLSPLAIAAGEIITLNKGKVPLTQLREKVLITLKETTVDDSIAVSKGIAFIQPGGLGKVDRYDISEDSFGEELKNDNINLYQLMQDCVNRDTICQELVNGYPIVFEKGLPILQQTLAATKDINLAIINAYLGILAKYPDTLIVRKFGKEKAQDISQRASEILQLGGAITIEGRRELEDLDIELREDDEKTNPGTTADLVAATIFIHLVSGGKLWHYP